MSGVVGLSVFLYYDHQLSSAYDKLGELGGLIELGRFGKISQLIFDISVISNLVFSILSLVKNRSPLGIVGLLLFTTIATLYVLR